MAEFRTVAQGLRFPEGPIVLADSSVILVEIRGEQLTRIWPDGRIEAVASLPGGPNGAAIGPDGAIYVCNNGGFVYGAVEQYGITIPVGPHPDYHTGSIQRVDLASGTVSTLYQSTPDMPLRGPNDIVFDAHGGFWFTDHGKTFHRTRDRVGVFYAKADGSHIEEVIFPLENPNGIGLSPDGSRLYVAETYTCQLWEFRLAAPGRIDPQPNLFGHGGRFIYRPEGFRFFDSLAVEASGNICVATIGTPHGITVVSPDGALVQFIETPEIFTTNIAFGGGDLRTAYITLSGTGQLIACEWPRSGLRLHQP